MRSNITTYDVPYRIGHGHPYWTLQHKGYGCGLFVFSYANGAGNGDGVELSHGAYTLFISY